MSSTAQTTARAVKDHASELASHLGRDISAMADDQKMRGVEVVRTVARAIDNAASEIEKESPTVASYVRDAAHQVENLSDRLRERSASDLMSAANDVARSQPILFFAGAVAAGFVLARFLKSSGRYRSYSGASTYPEHYGSEPMRGGTGGYRGATGAGSYGAGSSTAGQTAGRGSNTGSTGMGSSSTGTRTGSAGTSSGSVSTNNAGSTEKSTGPTDMNTGGSTEMSTGPGDIQKREGRHGRT